MSQLSTNNKRLAINTLLLYLRQLFVIVISLYTSRVVLNTLGVNDYGIHNIVGGVVGMLSFLTVALTSASQRFISYELGTGDVKKLKQVFTTSIIIHLLLGVFVLFVAETVGLWFLNTHLNIVSERMNAANWVYQCAILTTILSIITVPYNSVIVAHERMDVFAYVGIGNTIMKLIIVYLLLLSPWDKLITYAILGLLVQSSFWFIYRGYCTKHFIECKQMERPTKPMIINFFSFAGWSFVGNLGFSFKDQASNIILNLFFGTVVNAARGIANQVNGIMYNFTASFLMALNPQITKEYSGGNIKRTINMVYAGCRLSPYLMGIMCIPLIINTRYLLSLWLGDYPTYTIEFIQLTLIVAIIGCMATPIVTALQATGRIKVFQIVISIVMLSELPISYLVLRIGGLPYMAMYPTVVITFIGLYARFIILKNMTPEYSYKIFTKDIVLKNVFVLGLAYILSKYVYIDGNGLGLFLLNGISSFIITLFIVISFGLKTEERIILFNYIKNRFKRK
ncbi:lipopolysaccharide biosynthesis protein [Xylanibacter muris]|uniref:Lipopolysaccharide biosynthesis protein n=2 Tax=Xylanibacter muris TaxID=2736290 RepID=A0ABX2ARY2_9BACT|nr:lipopolysaccharide biosynthesis protein [Xylanibacter muris]NPD92797.1 lipopolysaccharide biosynthesis protein [Xylanibacter muris]